MSVLGLTNRIVGSTSKATNELHHPATTAVTINVIGCTSATATTTDVVKRTHSRSRRASSTGGGGAAAHDGYVVVVIRVGPTDFQRTCPGDVGSDITNATETHHTGGKHFHNGMVSAVATCLIQRIQSRSSGRKGRRMRFRYSLGATHASTGSATDIHRRVKGDTG